MPDFTPDEQKQQGKEFLALLREHERRLRAFVFALVPNWADADEIAQETRLRLWEQFDRYDPNKDFGAWMLTIAYYQVLKHREKAGRNRLVFSPEFLESVAQETERLPADAEARHAALAECLQKLSAAKRALVLRYYAGEETTRQIAAALGRSFDATRQTLLRTRLSLADCVSKTVRRNERS